MENLGETVCQFKDIPFSIDIVDIYRRSEFLPDVARDFRKQMLQFSGRSWSENG